VERVQVTGAELIAVHASGPAATRRCGAGPGRTRSRSSRPLPDRRPPARRTGSSRSPPSRIVRRWCRDRRVDRVLVGRHAHAPGDRHHDRQPARRRLDPRGVRRGPRRRHAPSVPGHRLPLTPAPGPRRRTDLAPGVRWWGTRERCPCEAAAAPPREPGEPEPCPICLPRTLRRDAVPVLWPERPAAAPLSLACGTTSGTRTPADTQREIGAPPSTWLTHFDLANNYARLRQRGVNFGASSVRTWRPTARADHQSRPAGTCARPLRPGRRLAQVHAGDLDQSLRRVGVDYFDIFYSHRST